jgi:zinc transport system substrate-binding protein
MYFIVAIFSAVFLFAPFGCNKQTPAPAKPDKPIVLTTIPPYAYFIQRIAGDTVTAQVLVPPGWDPHLFEPAPKQMQSLSQASIWLKTGEPFEKKMATVLKEKNPHLVMIEMWKGLPLLSQNVECQHCHHEEMKDLHVWLSPRLAQLQAKVIADALVNLLPEHRQHFAQGLATLLDDLARLDQHLSQLLQPFKHQSILVSHPAFAYFCKDYSLIQLSIEVEGKEALPRDITQTVKIAERKHVRSILAQPQYNQKGATLIAQKLQLPIYQIDPYSRDYLENLRHLGEIIAYP